MSKLDSIQEIITATKQGADGTTDLDARYAAIDNAQNAVAEDLEAAAQKKIATATAQATAEKQEALQVMQNKVEAAKTLLTSADIIANAITASTNNEIVDLDAVNTSIAKLAEADFDLTSDDVVGYVLSADVCGIKDMGIDSAYKFKTALNEMKKTNYQLTRQAAVSDICENYEVISCANDTSEYAAFAAKSLKEVKKAAATFDVTEATILVDAQKLETSEDAKENGAALRNMQTIIDAYTTTSASQTVAANIATIDNAVNTLKSDTGLAADEIFALTLGEHGIATQCQFDAKAKYLMCDADTDSIYKALVNLKAPTDRQITSAEVDNFRKIDFSTARLKAAGISDATCEEIQKKTKSIISTFTSMALRPDGSDPKAAYYPTSAKEQENEMTSLAINAYSEMTSASIKKLAMK